MAEQTPPVTAAPATAGFKLKLKLGGGNSSTTVSSAQSSSATTSSVAPPVASTSTIPASSSASTSQPAPKTANAPTGSGENGSPRTNTEDVDMLEDDNDDAEGDFAPAESGEHTLGKKAIARPNSKRKSSNSATPSGADASTIYDNATGDDSITQDAEQDASMLSNTSPGPSTSIAKSQDASAKYETSIGSIVLPASSTSTAGPSRKRKSAASGEAGGTGLGRGWRKGLKGYQRGDLSSPGPGAGRGETMSTTSSAGGSSAPSSRRRKAPAAAAATVAPSQAPADESSLDRNLDAEDFSPAMAPPGGIVTTEKWANGLPGGNEQSRLTASMANAVNRQFPVGLPPKTGSALLQPQPLDKNTPPPRSWRKVKREIVGPSGIPFTVTIWQGANESEYADYMVEHPRPPPVDKKATTALTGGLDTGSPAPEGSYPPSDGTPAEPASESASVQGQAGSAAGRGSRRGRGSARGRGTGTGQRRKPGPPKKGTALAPPIISSVADSAASTPVPESSNQSNTMPDPSVASSATSNVDTPSEAHTVKAEPAQEEAAVSQPKAEDTTELPAAIPA